MVSKKQFENVGGKLRPEWQPHTVYSDGLTKSLKPKASDVVWDFGWIPPFARTDKQAQADHDAQQEMPRFAIKGKQQDADQAFLFDLWKSEETKAALGFAYPGTHQLTGSCFPADTPVRMADGSEKPIQDVRIGDRVITHTGQARAVLNVFRRKYTGDLITVQVAGFPFPLEMTADHQVATVSSRSDWRWQPGRLEWKRADSLEIGDRALIGSSKDNSNGPALDLASLLGDKTIILDDLMEHGDAPVSNVGMAQYICRKSGVDWRGRVKLVRSRTENALLRYVPVCPSLARLIGLYLAEGGCDAGRVVFTFSSKEEHLAAEVLALVRGLFGVEGDIVRQAHRATVIKVRFNNQNLEAVFKCLVPGNVYSKRVPGLFFGADEATKLALILGWLDGDGYAAVRTRGKKSLRIQGVTVSADLARDVAAIALSIGVRTSVSKRKARAQSREAFDVFLSGPKAHALYPTLAAQAASVGLRQTETDSNLTQFGYARAVRSLETRAVQDLEVYDFEVEEDHSFLARGLTVHNCVGAGGGNVHFTLSAVEVLRLQDAEQIIVPHWLFTYGRSRFHCGDTGPGEGSQGSCYAKAALEDGIVPSNMEGLPKFTNTDGLIWGASEEMKWSAGGRKPVLDWMDKAKKHLVKSAARCKSADEVAQAIINGYPCTCASMYAHDGGKVQSDPPVLLARRTGQWSHQMAYVGYWKHPKLGPIFWLHNQWGLGAHGKDPLGPGGGVWVTAADVDWVCRDEVFAFSQFDGFPSQSFKWST